MKVKDENHIPELLKVLNVLSRKTIQIGIFGEDDSQILMIASVNEFGCKIKVTPKMRNYLRAIGLPLKKDTEYINIPERSFMRSGFDDRRDDIRDRTISLLKKVILMELDIDTFYNTIGEYAVSQLQSYLTSIDNPENHPYTVEHKGSSNPLIDSGRLREAITFKVVNR